MVHTRRYRSGTAPAGTSTQLADSQTQAAGSPEQKGLENAKATATRPSKLERKPLAARRQVQDSAAAQVPARGSNNSAPAYSTQPELQQPMQLGIACNPSKPHAQVALEASSKRSKKRASSSSRADPEMQPELQPEAILPAKRARLDQASRNQHVDIHPCSAEALVPQQAHASSDLDREQDARGNYQGGKHQSAPHEVRHEVDRQGNAVPAAQLDQHMAPHELQEPHGDDVDPRERRRKRRSAKHEAAESPAPGSQHKHETAETTAPPSQCKQSMQKTNDSAEPNGQHMQRKHEKADARAQRRQRRSEADADLPAVPTGSHADETQRRPKGTTGSQQPKPRHQHSAVVDQGAKTQDSLASEPAEAAAVAAEATAVVQPRRSSAGVRPARRHKCNDMSMTATDAATDATALRQDAKSFLQPSLIQPAGAQSEASDVARPPGTAQKGLSQDLAQAAAGNAAAAQPNERSSNAKPPAKKSKKVRSASRRRSLRHSMSQENASSQVSPRKEACKASEKTPAAPLSPGFHSPLCKQGHSSHRSSLPRPSLQDVTNSPLQALRVSPPRAAKPDAVGPPSSGKKPRELPLARQLIHASLPSPEKKCGSVPQPISKSLSPSSQHRDPGKPPAALQEIPLKARQGDKRPKDIPAVSAPTQQSPRSPKDSAAQPSRPACANVSEQLVLPAPAPPARSIRDDAAWFNALDPVKVGSDHSRQSGRSMAFGRGTPSAINLIVGLLFVILLCFFWPHLHNVDVVACKCAVDWLMISPLGNKTNCSYGHLLS